MNGMSSDFIPCSLWRCRGRQASDRIDFCLADEDHSSGVPRSFDAFPTCIDFGRRWPEVNKVLFGIHRVTLGGTVPQSRHVPLDDDYAALPLNCLSNLSRFPCSATQT